MSLACFEYLSHQRPTHKCATNKHDALHVSEPASASDSNGGGNPDQDCHEGELASMPRPARKMGEEGEGRGEGMEMRHQGGKPSVPEGVGAGTRWSRSKYLL